MEVAFCCPCAMRFAQDVCELQKNKFMPDWEKADAFVGLIDRIIVPVVKTIPSCLFIVPAFLLNCSYN